MIWIPKFGERVKDNNFHTMWIFGFWF